MKILVTGCCGFIGTNLCLELLKNDKNIVYGIDNFTDNYSLEYKKLNLSELKQNNLFVFYEEDVITTTKIGEILPDMIVHLASIPGVRKSLQDPVYYVKNNIEAFVYLLEECKKYNIKKVIYASSSSVYGLNTKVPFSESDPINNLHSSYACSKKCMEVYGKYYNDTFGIQTIGLRFFTVYGSRGRPDMAPYIFLKNIAEGTAIIQYGDGSSFRDYTYIGDIIAGIISIINGNGVWGEIYNLGNNNSITLENFIKLCEKITGKAAVKNILDIQLGDVPGTYADITKAMTDLNYYPSVSLEQGLTYAYNWMKDTGRINLNT
jgi:UDP-glucuronate 4-epimerase